MPALGRRPFVIAVACFGLGLVGYELWPRDETRITSLLSELCTQLNRTRDEASLGNTRRFLLDSLTPGATVQIAELSQDLEGAPLIAERAGLLLGGFPLSFTLSSVEVRLSGRLARVEADLTVTASGSGEQRRELRRSRVRLVKVGSAWRIEAIEVDPVAPSQMEARP